MNNATLIKFINHFTDSREDFFTVCYKSRRSKTYRLPDLPKTAVQFLWDANDVTRAEAVDGMKYVHYTYTE